MKRFALLLLPLLVAGVTLGYADDAQRAQKIREEGGKAIESVTMPLSIEAASGGWFPQVVDQASITYGGAQYLPPGVVFLSGYSATADYLYRSYDNGGTWTRLDVPSNNLGFVYDAKDSNLVLAGTFGGLIVRSTNGGTKWDSVYKHTDYIDGIRFVGANVAVAIGDKDASGPPLLRSTDAGKTWVRLPLPSAADSAMDYAYATYRQAMAVYNNTVWIPLYKSSGASPIRILKSTDAGATWTSSQVVLTGGTAQNYYIRSINFANDSLGFIVDRQVASGLANYVHRTTNGGLTWSDTLSLQPGAHSEANARSVKLIPGTNSVLVAGSNSAGTSARMWISPDLGVTFNPITVTGVALTNTALLDSTHMYAVGSGSTVLKYTGKLVRKVTFNMNTATVPDTLPVTGSVTQIRGGVNNAGGLSPITWGNDAQNNMTRVGGDYWKKDLYMQVGDTLNYKYVIQHPSNNTGWEQGVVPTINSQTNQNRTYVVADKDTVLPVEFWNNGASDRPQYFRPYPAVADSYFTVYFRVNMLGPISSGTFAYNNDKDTVGVRGGGPTGSDLNWAPTFYLTRENTASNWNATTVQPNSFWSKGLKFPKSAVTEGQSIAYKFLIGYDWGRDELQSQPNRSFTVPIGKKDTTLYFSYYNNERPTQRANPDTVALTFRVNLAQTAASGGFNITSDTIQVRTGYFSTGNDPGRSRQMVRLSGTVFQFADTIVTAKNKNLDYQYYVVRSGVDTRENYYNFNYSGPTPSEAERRQFLIPTTASRSQMTFVYDTSTSITQDRRQPMFPNSRKLARNVRVRYEVDLRPAYYTLVFGDSLFDVQSAFRTIVPADKDSIQKWGVWINGLAVGGWNNPTGSDWGQALRDNLNKKMYDNGTNGDRVANDSIWTRQVFCSPDSFGLSTTGTKGQVGQIFKWGVYGGDNEGGRGGYGNNNAANIVDADTAWTITDQFGSINPKYYRFWDYDNHKPKVPTAVGEAPVPLTFDLQQNYPNPFNPATQISYSLPVQSKVELKVFNVLGQVVATLVDEVKPAGAYTARFDATSFATGMYIYKLQAGNFSSVKKMLLVK